MCADFPLFSGLDEVSVLAADTSDDCEFITKPMKKSRQKEGIADRMDGGSQEKEA